MNSIKATIRRVANRFGVEITRIPKTKSSSMTQEYGTVSPAATYSPWNKDNSFQAMFASIGGEHADTSRQAVEELILTRMNLDNVEILEGIFPDQTGHRVEGMQFRFCHIDVDVYQSAKDVVDWIWDKMVPGGIMVYDDYGFYGCDGITKYVEEQMMRKDRLVIHNLNGHAIILKL